MKTKTSRHFEGGFLGVALFFLALALLVLGCIYWQSSREAPLRDAIELHFLDVGQGDAAYIRTPEGTVLIDAGEADAAKSLYFSLHPYSDRIDVLILTHPHTDHIGGAAYILENMTVGQVLLPAAVSDEVTYTRLLTALEKSGVPVRTLEAGLSFTLGGARFTVLAPLDTYENENDESAVIRIEYGSTSALITGDAEAASEADQIAQYGDAPGGLLDCNLLKVAHHGSSSSSSAAYLTAVTPQLALISVGRDNGYGHPSRSVIEQLAAIGAEVFRTDRDGTLVFVSDGKEIRRKP